jgi:L-aminopeptidase/D-esterase-like protein
MSAGRLTDVPGVRVGHVTDVVAGSGCTAILPAPGMVGAVDVRGGGASVRETELLQPRSGEREIAALMLSGGSAFGLAVADGAMRWCDERGIGLAIGAGMVVPIVPAAVIFDLGITANQRRPTADDGYAACDAASSEPHAVGSVGAGTGATVGKWHGRDGWCKGGLGAASAVLPDGHVVAVLAVVNAFGDVIDDDGTVLAGVWAPGRGFLSASAAARTGAPKHPRLQGTNTTLLCVATDAPVGSAGAGQLARAASTGSARAINPVATALDGDVSFALAARGTDPAFVASVVAADLAAAAIRNGIRTANSVRGVPAANGLHSQWMQQ